MKIIVVNPEHKIEVDDCNKSISGKIRDAREKQIPALVLGDKEIQFLIDNGLIREWL